MCPRPVPPSSSSAALHLEQAPFTLPPRGPAGPDLPGGGRGGAVLVLHGFTSGPASVRAWAEGMATRGVTVRVPLLPGHGTHWRDLAGVSASDLRGAVRAELDALLAVHERVVVAGLSMGGALALDAAAHRPVAGVLVVNPALRFARPAALAAPALRHVVASVPAIAGDIADPHAREIAYERTPVAGVAALGAVQRAARRGLPRITAGVTVFRSAVDAVVPAASHRTLLRGIRAAPVRVVDLPRSHHVATLDHDLPLLITESRAALRHTVEAAPPRPVE